MPALPTRSDSAEEARRWRQPAEPGLQTAAPQRFRQDQPVGTPCLVVIPARNRSLEEQRRAGITWAPSPLHTDMPRPYQRSNGGLHVTIRASGSAGGSIHYKLTAADHGVIRARSGRSAGRAHLETPWRADPRFPLRPRFRAGRPRTKPRPPPRRVGRRPLRNIPGPALSGPAHN